MVKERTITVYVDETTGKEYKTKDKAMIAENKNLKKQAIHTLAKELGFYGERYYKPEDKLYQYLVKQVDNVTSKKLQLNLQVLAMKLNLVEATPSDPESAVKIIKSLYESVKNDLMLKKEFNLIVYLDGKEIHNQIITGYNKDTDLTNYYKSIIDPFTMLRKDVVQDGTMIKVTFETITNEPIMSEYDALIKASIEKWSVYQDYIDAYKSDKLQDVKLSDEEEYNALENAGVDNWSGYDYVFDLVNEDQLDWFDLSDTEKLQYLEYAGVDNWSYYYEALEEARREKLIFTDKDLKEATMHFIKDNDISKWDGYYSFIKNYYGLKN